MKTLPLICSLVVAGLAMAGLSSCVGIDGGYGGGYGAPYYGGYGPSYYGGGGYYSHDHHDHGHDHDHDHGHSHNHNHSSDNKIKLVRGSDGDHPRRPEGYHTKEWYQKRGYDLKEYTHKHQESGDVHKGSKSSSSSNSHKHGDNHKSSDNHKSDDKPTKSARH